MDGDEINLVVRSREHSLRTGSPVKFSNAEIASEASRTWPGERTSAISEESLFFVLFKSSD